MSTKVCVTWGHVTCGVWFFQDGSITWRRGRNRHSNPNLTAPTSAGIRKLGCRLSRAVETRMWYWCKINCKYWLIKFWWLAVSLVLAYLSQGHKRAIIVVFHSLHFHFLLQSKEGTHRFFKGDNNKIVKIHWSHFKIVNGPISAKLGTKHPFVRGFQVYSNGRPCSFWKTYHSLAQASWFLRNGKCFSNEWFDQQATCFKTLVIPKSWWFTRI